MKDDENDTHEAVAVAEHQQYCREILPYFRLRLMIWQEIGDRHRGADFGVHDGLVDWSIDPRVRV